MSKEKLDLRKVERLFKAIQPALSDISVFALGLGGTRLRRYQEAPARAVVQSVVKKQGLGLAVMFPRQSGKNELQAQIETYLLLCYSTKGGEIIKVSPTWKPQSQNAMRRLERTLDKNALTRKQWKKEAGHIYRIGKARVIFLSAEPNASIVGATASLLLEVDEAQDVQVAKFDKDVAPMAAATDATRVFWGTAWTSTTLLARELRAAQAAEEEDGARRVFSLSGEQVALEVPAYRTHLLGQVKRLGRNHPSVRTQYFSEELDAGGGMFTPERLARMHGDHPANLAGGEAGKLYALLIDVAGEDETAAGGVGEALMRSAGRDATALTVVEVTPAGNARPTYRVVNRCQWVGIRHTLLYQKIVALAALWHALYVVVDATGVGAGLASFLGAELGPRVLPFLFTSASKSQLGWDFLAIVDAGRYQEPHPCPDTSFTSLQEAFWQQCAFCTYEVGDTPERRMKWGVKDGTRDPATGELVHDDLLISAALVARLDELTWARGEGAALLPMQDPLVAMDREGY